MPNKEWGKCQGLKNVSNLGLFECDSWLAIGPVCGKKACVFMFGSWVFIIVKKTLGDFCKLSVIDSGLRCGKQLLQYSSKSKYLPISLPLIFLYSWHSHAA